MNASTSQIHLPRITRSWQVLSERRGAPDSVGGAMSLLIAASAAILFLAIFVW